MSAKVHDGLKQAAITVMSRAIKYDNEGKYPSALACYQEGIQLCLDAMKTSPDKNKAERFRQKVEEYIARAEQVKEIVQQQKDSGNLGSLELLKLHHSLYCNPEQPFGLGLIF